MKPVGKMQGFVNANTPVPAPCDKFKKKSKLTKKIQDAQAKRMGQGAAQRP